MENDIDLLILPPHCSHILQPLDVGVFSAFKRAYSKETDQVSQLSSQRISRREWMQMFIRARQRAVVSDNILSGWRGAGLMPSDPSKVLDRLPSETTFPALKPRTPPDGTNLDFSLLLSSPPDGTELRQSNVRLNQVLAQVPEVPEEAKRYTDRVTRMAETQNAEITVLRQQVKLQNELLNTRKKRTRGKRVRLEGVRVYSTPEVLRVAREVESKPVAKRPRGRPRKRPIEEVADEDEAEELESSSSESESQLIESVARRTRSNINVLI